MPEFTPVSESELNTRDRWLTQELIKISPDFKDWLLRVVEDGRPRLFAKDLAGFPQTLNNHLPWLIDIDVFMTPISHTNFNTNTLAANTFHGGSKDSSGAQNAVISFDVVLAAGTWTFEMMHRTASDRGIYTVALSVTGSLGTIDGYSGLSANNALSSLTSINVREPIKQRLTLTMATKNASSSSYVGSIQHIQLRRTDSGGGAS